MSITHRLAQGLLAAAATVTLLAAAPANAAVIASFDPAFGPAYPGLGFRGTATFDVSAGCYNQGSGYIATSATCVATALHAEVDFYNLAQLNQPTIGFNLLDSTFFTSGYVNAVYIDPLTGQVSGFSTNDSAIFNPNAPGYVTDTSTFMVLYFTIPSPILIESASFVTNAAVLPGPGSARLRRCAGLIEDECLQGEDPDNFSLPASVIVTAVPEPDSIALALLGLGALVATRRRRAAAVR